MHGLPHQRREDDAVDAWQQRHIVGLQNLHSILHSKGGAYTAMHVQGGGAIVATQQHVCVLADNASGVEHVVGGTAVLYFVKFQSGHACSWQHPARRTHSGKGDGAVWTESGAPLGACWATTHAWLLPCKMDAGCQLLQMHRNGHQAAQTQLQLQGCTNVHCGGYWLKLQLSQLSKRSHAQDHLLV